jgi:hypothetical protein
VLLYFAIAFFLRCHPVLAFPLTTHNHSLSQERITKELKKAKTSRDLAVKEMMEAGVM